MKNKFRINIKILFFMLLIIAAIPVGITFSKYVHNFVGNYLLKTKSFYFNSDKLGSPAINYNVNNWSGVGDFTIQFELNNHKNNLLISDSDISYDIDLTCPNDVVCSIDNSSGIIYQDEMTDNFIVTVSPLRVFNTNESVNVTITATSSSPYVKTLEANFVMSVGKQGVVYEIIDSVNKPYFDFTITNARDQYVVFESFDSYSVSQIISVDTYKSLSNVNKKKCYSARVTLTFDPREVLIDTTSNIIKNSTYQTEVIDGVSYIKSLTFDIEAMSSNVLRFYKTDVTNDYTYPFENTSSVVSFVSV